MNYTVITSRSNQKIKYVRRLSDQSSERNRLGLFVLEGLRLCRDAALNGVKAEEVYFTDEALKKHEDDINRIISMSVSAYCVSADLFQKIGSTENSQGVLTVCDKSVLSHIDKIDTSGRYIACENLSDPANLGAVARTAEALGLSGLILLGTGCDSLNPKALRASMGALIRLPVIHFTDSVQAIRSMQNDGMRVYASVVDPDAIPITEVKFGNGDVVIIGNEANGMSVETVDVCDERITIPIRGRAESFNAAVAATVFMWELKKIEV